jgi:predicted Ser/Thr protein kinase
MMVNQECRHCNAVVADGALFCHLRGGEVGDDGSPGAHARLRERLARALDGRYRVHDVLGAGGMGVVFLADDLRDDRKVAIKVLLPELAGDANIVARFAREARTAAGLDHPGIVRIFGEASEHGLHYFVMQYVEGRSLQELLRDDPRMPIPLVTRILCEAAAALEHAHRHGVVHRDVKPENIMLDPGGRVMLADFGISKMSRAGASGATTMLRLTETGGVIGTPHYMAPEHALGQAVDGRTDQYALAVVGFEMLAGRLPFDDETAPAIIHLHLNTAAPRLSSLRPDVPPRLAAAIARAMSKAQSNRFPTMEEFAAAVAGSSASAPGARRSASWVVALLLAGGIAGGAWWIWQAGLTEWRRPAAAPAAVKRQTIKVSITATPTATVYIDGRRIGVTPIVDHNMTGTSDHLVRLERKGYRTIRDTIRMTAAPNLRRSYMLRRERR